MNGFYTRLTYKGMERALKMTSIPVPSEKDKIQVDDSALLNFIAWGDPQISSLSPLRAARLTSACKDLNNSEGKFDALLLLGDITEYGRECEYNMTRNILSESKDKFDNLLCVSGNHDVRLRAYKHQVQKFENFVKSVPNGRVSETSHYYFSVNIKGYKFIMLGTDTSTFEGEYLSRKQLSWLDKELATAEKGKPVFVLNHQTIANTNGLPRTWLGKGNWRGSVGRQSEKLANIMSKYPNTIYITGHLHYGVSKYNYEDCGNFKSLSVPTVGVMNHGEFDYDAQGYIISVYDDKIICRARIFGKGEWVDKDVQNSIIEIPIKK